MAQLGQAEAKINTTSSGKTQHCGCGCCCCCYISTNPSRLNNSWAHGRFSCCFQGPVCQTSAMKMCFMLRSLVNWLHNRTVGKANDLFCTTLLFIHSRAACSHFTKIKVRNKAEFTHWTLWPGCLNTGWDRNSVEVMFSMSAGSCRVELNQKLFLNHFAQGKEQPECTTNSSGPAAHFNKSQTLIKSSQRNRVNLSELVHNLWIHFSMTFMLFEKLLIAVKQKTV